MSSIFTARRLDTDGMSIITRWLDPSGAQFCFCLEPGAERLPHPTIPAGIYPLRLRTVGEKHAAYLKRYGPAFHKGMVEICDVPGRTAIEFHIGNTIADTLGCSLAGENAIEPRLSHSGHWEVARSRAAYEQAYPILRDAILAGSALLQIVPLGGAVS